MFTGNKADAMTGAIAEVFPDATYQRRTVHFYNNVLFKVLKTKLRQVEATLKAIHAQESMDTCKQKADSVVKELEAMKLNETSKCIDCGVTETLTYIRFPMVH